MKEKTFGEKLRGIFGLTYDATENTNRRRFRDIKLRSEDKELTDRDRKRLVSNTRDLQRNMSIAAWAVRKHLDYVSTFTFQCRSGNPELDKRIESLVDWWSRPKNFDVAARHSLRRYIRLLEERRTIDGDVFTMKLRDGRVQGIEGDRVRTPTHQDGKPLKLETKDVVHGVRLDVFGGARSYIVCDRGEYANQFNFNREIPAQYVYQLGYFDRIDQVRGVSPMASALNTFSDVYESAEYALAKAKVSQLFGLKFKRSGDDSLPVDTDSDGDTIEPYAFDFGKGPQLLDLDPGDDADFMESKTPSTEFADYCDRMIAAALKSLDIPYSFFDESHTNYSGARQALLQYEQSAANKRADLQQLLNQMTAWRLGLFVEDGILSLPRGMRLGDLKWEWIPTGLPWVDPLKESQADAMAVATGLSSRQRIAKSRGNDWFTIADELEQENEILREKGITVGGTVMTINGANANDNN